MKALMIQVTASLLLSTTALAVNAQSQNDVKDLIKKTETLQEEDYEISLLKKKLEKAEIKEEIAKLQVNADEILTPEDVKAMIQASQQETMTRTEASRLEAQRLQMAAQPEKSDKEDEDKVEPAKITEGLVTSIYRNKPGGNAIAEVILRDGTTAILEEGQSVDGWMVESIQLKKVVLSGEDKQQAVLRYGIVR